MALKFLNKKGWHTGSLRNIENVWKAEQKHDSEQKKLEELRKQIQEERERSEFRLLQEQAGLVPKQERLDFLYDSGLAVGKGSSSDGFKALEALPKKTETTDTSSSSKQQASVPGALFEEKPQSANDTWRKLHSDPLLLIRQREQEALARIKNNPIQMSMIRKSVEANKKHERKENKKHHHQKNSNHDKLLSSKGQSNSENPAEEGEERRKWSHHKNSRHEEHSSKGQSASEVTARKGREGRSYQKNLKHEDHSSKRQSESEAATSDEEERRQCSHHRSKKEKHSLDSEAAREREYKRRHHRDSDPQIWRSETNSASTDTPTATFGHRKHRPTASKLSEEERAARLREMQMDAKLHEEQRWKRLKKALEDDAQEASQAGSSGGRNFLNAAQKSIYGAEKGGSSTIEESVRRRTYYLQGQSEAGQGNAFRR